MQEGKPIFKLENIEYEREEKEGYWTIVPKFHPETRELVINRTAREILELCNGARTIEQIEAEMQSRYLETPNDLIYRDLCSTLARFSRLLVIEWDGENPFLYKREEIINDEFSLMIAEESDIIEIKSFIDNSGVLNGKEPREGNFAQWIYKNPRILSLEYELVSIRSKIFAYMEEFFLLVGRDKISGLLSISGGLFAAVIKLMIVSKDYFVDLLRYSVDNLPFISVHNITKIKVELLLPSLMVKTIG